MTLNLAGDNIFVLFRRMHLWALIKILLTRFYNEKEVDLCIIKMKLSKREEMISCDSLGSCSLPVPGCLYVISFKLHEKPGKVLIVIVLSIGNGSSQG